MSASAAFAATDDNATVSDVNDEIAIDENILSVENDAVLQEESTPVLGSSVVTNDTFYNYFDKNTGELSANVTDDELIFEGDFTGVGQDGILITKPIKLTGNNATFKGMSITVASDNVTIDGFKLSGSDFALISVQDMVNTVISNNVIDFEAMPGSNSYAIWAYAVDNLKLVGNTITYVGNTTGTTINSAVRVEGNPDKKSSKNVTVDGNTFIIKMPSTEISYADYPNAIVYSDGISFVYCEDLQFINNDVSLSYNTFDLGNYGSDTIYVVEVSSIFNMDWISYELVSNMSDNILISNNTINAYGHNATYGIVVCANNFEISDNEVIVASEKYYANGISIGSPSANGTVKKNGIAVNAEDVVYGIYSYAYMGPVENMTYDSNLIYGKAYFDCGMEIIETNPTISNNFIDVKGNHTTGIVANMGDNGTVAGNEIYSLGTNIGNETTGDGMLHLESAGISIRGDTLIANNTVESTAIGLNLILGGDFTVDGNFIRVVASGDTDNYGIYADNKVDYLSITDNEIYFIGYTDGTIFSKGLSINGIDDVLIQNNKFELSLVGADINWTTGDKYSEGIAIVNSEDAIFNNNTVEVIYNNYTGSYDTIYAVDLAGSDNSVISNNKIDAKGYTYIYGIVVTSANFIIFNNTVYAVADNYGAYAINPDAGANGVVENNTLVAVAPDVVYTIYSSMYGSSTSMDIDYIGNSMYGKAYYVNVFDVAGANENIINNTIVAAGNYTIAIVSGSANNTISGNTIRSLGSGEGNKTIDYTLKEVEAIKLFGANAVISDNYIDTTGAYAIDLGNTDSTVENNYVAAKNSVGPAAIVNAGAGAKISNITPSLKIILASPRVITTYVDGAILVVMAYDENGNPVGNLSLFSVIRGNVYNATTDDEGYAAFVLDLDAGYNEAVTTFYGNEVYGPKTIVTPITVDASATQIVAPASKTVLLTAVKKGTTYKITLKDMNDNGLANQKVTISFNGKTNTYTTDSVGVINYKLSATKTGTKKITMKFAGDKNYAGTTQTATIKLTKEASKLTAAKKSYKAKTKVKKYTVTLKDSKGKAIKKVKVTLKVKGKTYKATTNAKGKATFKITKLTKRGSFTAKVKFAGNAYYKASTKSVKITVKK